MLFLLCLVFLMGMYVDKLDAIKLFICAARLKSFTAAANELNMTQGAVSKKIAWLESKLGFTLFHRNSRKISLTNSGEQYLAFCHELIESMTLTEQNLKGELSRVTGVLKLSAPSVFATQQLAVPIRKFLLDNPDLTVDISVNDKHIDLYKDDIDIAIRATFLKDSGLKARKLLEHELCHFASPEYLERNGCPVQPSDISSHMGITYSLSTPSNVWYLNGDKYPVRELIKSDSPEMIVEMAKLGCGIAAMPKWMVQESLDNNHLIELFKEQKKYSLPMYAVYKNTEYLPYRIRAFIDFLTCYFESGTNR